MSCSSREFKTFLVKNGVQHCGAHQPSGEELRQIQNDIDKFKEKGGLQNHRGKVIEIDVYFHIFTTSSGDGAISDETVMKQMDILNDAFSGVPSSYSECSGFTYEAQTATPFRFNLVHLETIVDDAAFNLDSCDADTRRAELRKGDCSDLNIFTGYTSYLGWATFPNHCPGDGNPEFVANELDSVVLLYSSLPEMGAVPYDEGDTATHEVGHWLGLLHTFHDGGFFKGEKVLKRLGVLQPSQDCIDGDLVEGTPAESSPAYGCPIERDTCSDTGRPE